MDLSAYVGIWAGLHLQIATLTNNPEINIGEQTAAAWLTRLGYVLRHYPLEESQKAADWGAFVIVSGMIYIPMLAAIRARRSAPPPQPQAPIFQFNEQPPAPAASGETLQ